jgi:hypothetical protein
VGECQASREWWTARGEGKGEDSSSSGLAVT